jgi:UDP-GlcNAc:undecaprenyl-phosphate GlcNAc-1-phosphate transferase
VTPVTGVVAVFAAALALAAILVPVVRRVARGGGLFEHPVEDRWHRQPVPKFGGAAMAITFLVAAWPVTSDNSLRLLVAAPLAMFLLGLVDDLRPVRPAVKFSAQVATAAGFLALAPDVTITGQPVVDALIAVVWFVGITNAFNLLDNIDGLAAGVATIAGAFLVASLLVSGHPVLAALALPVAAITGVAAGFLIYNWHPASIFMGDGGSHLLGAFFASATLLTVPHLEIEGGGATIAVVLLLVPCADTALVMLTRQLSGRSAFVGGRDHLSHRLVALGTDDRAAVVVLYGVAAVGGFAALSLQTLGATAGWAIVASYAAAVGALGVYLAHVDVRSDARRRSRLPLPTELITRYRLYEVALDALLIALAYYLGLVTRFREPERFSLFLAHFTDILPVVATIHLVALWLAGKYRRTPVRTALSAALTILRGGALGSAGSVIAVLYLTRFEGYSRIAFAVAAVFVVALLWSEHFALRALDEFLRRRQRPDRLAIVYGAGDRGALAVRELRNNVARGLTPLGLIDDDPARRRDEVEGARVLGSLEDLDRVLADARGAVSTVIVAIRLLPDDRFDRLCATCDRHKVDVQRLRFSLDEVDTDARSRKPGVVRFPRA